MTAQAAYDQHTPLEHDILRRVAQCSADPDEAVNFFMLMLWPKPEERLVQPHLHPYMYAIYHSLEAPAYDKSMSERVQLAGRDLLM